MGQLAGKVAIVSGAGAGIGQACARALARDGASVVVAARSQGTLDEAVAAVEVEGGTALAVATDVGDMAQCRRLVETAAAHFGRLDVVVNVAAYSGGHATVEALELDDFRAAFEVNVLGTLEISRQALPHLRAAGGGAIVQISTLAVRGMQPKQAAYSATKRALTTASQTLAKEVGPDGVRVNIVVPGYIHGPHLEALFARISAQTGRPVADVYAEAAAATALRRLPTPDDVAEAVLFLASPRSAAITGVALDVTGGLLID